MRRRPSAAKSERSATSAPARRRSAAAARAGARPAGRQVAGPHSVAIVVPAYNEQEALERFHADLRRVIDRLKPDFTICYVNDGSTDQTSEVLDRIAASDRRVERIELSRNFGHQAAISAGLDQVDADVVITMDGDGQHPPGLLPEMLRLHASGFEVVLTQRADEPGLGRFKRWSSSLFYRLLNRVGDTRLIPGSADFRSLTREVVHALRGMREYHRFLRGMIAWIGFRTAILPFSAPPRLGGTSKYSLRKMVRLAMDAVFSFSLVPLYVGITLGLGFLILALAEAVYVLSFWLRGAQSSLVPGWSSLMFMILVVGGALMVVMGFIGIYVGYVFQEVKRRPAYVVRRSRTGRPAGTRPTRRGPQGSRDERRSRGRG